MTSLCSQLSFSVVTLSHILFTRTALTLFFLFAFFVSAPIRSVMTRRTPAVSRLVSLRGFDRTKVSRISLETYKAEVTMENERSLSPSCAPQRSAILTSSHPNTVFSSKYPVYSRLGRELSVLYQIHEVDVTDELSRVGHAQDGRRSGVRLSRELPATEEPPRAASMAIVASQATYSISQPPSRVGSSRPSVFSLYRESTGLRTPSPVGAKRLRVSYHADVAPPPPPQPQPPVPEECSLPSSAPPTAAPPVASPQLIRHEGPGSESRVLYSAVLDAVERSVALSAQQLAGSAILTKVDVVPKLQMGASVRVVESTLQLQRETPSGCFQGTCTETGERALVYQWSQKEGLETMRAVCGLQIIGADAALKVTGLVDASGSRGLTLLRLPSSYTITPLNATNPTIKDYRMVLKVISALLSRRVIHGRFSLDDVWVASSTTSCFLLLTHWERSIHFAMFADRAVGRTLPIQWDIFSKEGGEQLRQSTDLQCLLRELCQRNCFSGLESESFCTAQSLLLQISDATLSSTQLLLMLNKLICTLP